MTNSEKNSRLDEILNKMDMIEDDQTKADQLITKAYYILLDAKEELK